MKFDSYSTLHLKIRVKGMSIALYEDSKNVIFRQKKVGIFFGSNFVLLCTYYLKKVKLLVEGNLVAL